jgi:hypothetical protein
MKKLIEMIFGFNFLASKKMIKGGASSGASDSANSYYYYDGRS